MAEKTNHHAGYKQPNKRVPGKNKPSTAAAVKKAHRLNGRGLSLKLFTRAVRLGPLVSLTTDAMTMLRLQVDDWIFNKRVNTSKNQLCVGRTRSRVKKGGSNKGAEKNLSGK